MCTLHDEMCYMYIIFLLFDNIIKDAFTIECVVYIYSIPDKICVIRYVNIIR